MAEGPEERSYVEFYRADSSAAVRRYLVPAVLLLTVGPPLILFSATMKQMPGHFVFGFIGAALMMCGLVTGFGGIATLLLDDRYVAVAEEGLVVHLGKEESFYAWDDLAGIACEGGALVISPKGGAAVSIPFSKARAQKTSEIATRLEDWRRKSAWNLAPR